MRARIDVRRRRVTQLSMHGESGTYLADMIRTWHPRSSSPTPFHGRSRVIYIPGVGWMSFKGGGWTWGEKPWLVSRKEPQMIFGIFGRAEADRELAVSRWLHDRSEDATDVLGWVSAAEVGVFSPQMNLDGLRFGDGSAVDPVILAVRSRIPVRVADLAFLRGASRSRWYERTCRARGWSAERFDADFAQRLGEALARLHLLGGTNDTLTWDNITLAAEWIDFEWLFVPGHPLPDGTTDQRLAERQWKSCVDAFEVVDKLSAMLGGDLTTRRYAIRCCMEAYERSDGPVRIRSDWVV